MRLGRLRVRAKGSPATPPAPALPPDDELEHWGSDEIIALIAAARRDRAAPP